MSLSLSKLITVSASAAAAFGRVLAQPSRLGEETAFPILIESPFAYRRPDTDDMVEVSAALHREAVEWSDADAQRACVEHLDTASRAYALLMQLEQACRRAARSGETELALVSYYCREHRGNPRRLRVVVTPHYEGMGEVRFTADFA